MRTEYKRLLIFLVVLFLFIIIFTIFLAWPLLTGTKIVLATQPVDPFDMFRGQYLNINYEISRIPSIEGIKIGEDVYVSVKEDESGIWRYDKAGLVEPVKGVFLKGEIKSVFGGNMMIEYGIEQYFFQRNARLNTINMTVEARVSKGGTARIVQLFSNGKPIKIDYSETKI